MLVDLIWGVRPIGSMHALHPYKDIHHRDRAQKGRRCFHTWITLKVLILLVNPWLWDGRAKLYTLSQSRARVAPFKPLVHGISNPVWARTLWDGASGSVVAFMSGATFKLMVGVVVGRYANILWVGLTTAQIRVVVGQPSCPKLGPFRRSRFLGLRLREEPSPSPSNLTLRTLLFERLPCH